MLHASGQCARDVDRARSVSIYNLFDTSAFGIFIVCNMSSIMARAEALGLTPRSKKRRARPTISDEQTAEVREAFDLFDVEKRGSIDYHEVKVAVRALGFPLKKDKLRELLEKYEDDDETRGRLDYDDFLDLMTHLITSRDPEDEMKSAFALFDLAGDGKITLRNLRKICREVGENFTEVELQSMIDEFDADEDGAISFDEFKAMLGEDGM